MQRVASRPSVLVVDDDPLYRELATDILRLQGMMCRTAGDAADALQACEAAPPDLILLDLKMPGMDGIETCRRLKARPAWAAIPVIVLTAEDDPTAVRQIMEAGSLLCLTKPVAVERLVAAVRVALQGRTP